MMVGRPLADMWGVFFGLLRLVRLDYLMMGMIGRVFGRIWVGIPF